MQINDDPVALTPVDLPDAWQGIAEWTRERDMWQPWRIAPALLAAAGSDVLTDRAMIPNGGRHEVHTDAHAMSFDIVGDPDRDSCLEVLVADTIVAQVKVTAERTSEHIELPDGDKYVQIWLPHSARTQISPLRFHGVSVIEATSLGRGGSPTPDGTPLPRWVTYGSSISQCNSAPGPTRTWPALVARSLGWNLTALGFGGQCHLDQAVARTIRDMPADLISLCLGINIYGSATYNARSLTSATTGFIQTVRDGHPHTPIVVMSPIGSPSREQEINPAEFTLAQVRETVERAVTTLQGLGDDNIYAIDGLGIIALSEDSLLGDGLHPTPDGYQVMANRLAPHLSAAMDTTTTGPARRN